MPPVLRAVPRPFRETADALSALPDPELLARVGGSDPEAASVFVRRFQRRAFGLAFTILGDARAAEDVAQEALLRAWRHASTFDPRRGRVETWLLTITRNLAIDAIRVRRPTAIAPDDFLDVLVPSTERNPSDAAVVSDDLGLLREALADLPEEQSRAVVLAGVYGLTAQEIAEREAIPLGTAKTRIRTALGRLRVALADAEPFDGTNL